METDDPSDPNRRLVIFSIGTAVASGIAGGITGALGGDLWAIGKNLFTDVPLDAQKDLLAPIFGTFEEMPSVFAGTGNRRALINGERVLSEYLYDASCTFNSYIANAFGKKLLESDDGKIFAYRPEKNHLFLGGPVANDVVAKISGYTFKEIIENGKKVQFPVLDRKSTRLRWAFNLGTTGYGIYNGQEKKALRYEKGELVERPLYGLIDLGSNIETFSGLDDGNFLQNDFLTIIKLQEQTTGKYQVIIGGKHGYSTKAFSRDLSFNLENTLKLILGKGNPSEFQILIPAPLIHYHNKTLVGGNYTKAELDWSGAKIQNL